MFVYSVESESYGLGWRSEIDDDDDADDDDDDVDDVDENDVVKEKMMMTIQTLYCSLKSKSYLPHFLPTRSKPLNQCGWATVRRQSDLVGPPNTETFVVERG